jgi:hypothetical protein
MGGQINKGNLFGGVFTIAFGVYIYISGPIDFRGAPVANWVGVLIALFGVAIVVNTLLTKNSYNPTTTFSYCNNKQISS